MAVNMCCMCFVFITFLTHEIICRTVDSKTVPTVINALNQSVAMLENLVPNTTESTSTSNAPTASTVTSNSLEICEYFDDQSIVQPNFRFHDHGATVIMPLFWQLWIRQVVLLSKLEARFHKAGYEHVKFFIVTQNYTYAERFRSVSRQMEVIVVNETLSNQLSDLEDRSAYIFDSCGRHVYVIHYPYSSVQKPFVKASVLSTIYDRPCGHCPTNVSVNNDIQRWIY